MYRWVDDFFKGKAFERNEAIKLEKLHYLGTSEKTYCTLTGDRTDGRELKREADEYRTSLSALLSRNFDRLLEVYDAIWDTPLANLV